MTNLMSNEYDKHIDSLATRRRAGDWQPYMPMGCDQQSRAPERAYTPEDATHAACELGMDHVPTSMDHYREVRAWVVCALLLAAAILFVALVASLLPA